MTELLTGAARLEGLNLAGVHCRGESDLPRNSFVGLRCADTSFRFRGSDLSSCRFIGARLERIDFQDCNLYHVHFETALMKGINLRYCNTEEAHFS